MTSILLGCDPEVFVKKEGIFKSAYGLIKGDKKNPQKVHRGAVQVDGMALEFNIDPAGSEDEFFVSVDTVLTHMKSMVPEYEVVATPVAHFDLAYLQAQPEEAKELGCDPDFNAWFGGDANPRPDGGRPMRTAAGHIHVGWTENENIDDPDHRGRANMVVKNLDFFLGLTSLEYDMEAERREMYGKAGACRYKSYGVEYRTLSNAWLQSEKLMRWVYRAARKGVEETMAGNMLFERHGDIQAIINTSDLKAARAIIKSENLEVCHG